VNLNREAISIPEAASHGQTVTLSKRIAAVQLVRKENGTAALGPLSQLGPGIAVECCGNGYNERTVQVRAGNQFYFVFIEDLNVRAYPTRA
jgi:hypothetical protein